MECLEWTGYLDKDGYGNIQIAGAPRRVHRIVWMQDNGHTDLFILHSCDNPSCYNIDHLFAGTAADNTHDMIEKGRGGEQKVTHCPAGHPYDGDNLVVRYNGARRCRKCHKEVCRKSRTSESHARQPHPVPVLTDASSPCPNGHADCDPSEYPICEQKR